MSLRYEDWDAYTRKKREMGWQEWKELYEVEDRENAEKIRYSGYHCKTLEDIINEEVERLKHGGS